MDKTLEIYFIRHAHAAGGKLDGREKSDSDVTELGEKQLKALTKRFEGAKFDAIFTSPLVRTVKTAAAVAKGIGNNIPIEVVPEIIEKGTTPGYFGLPTSELKKYYDNLVMCKDTIHKMPQTGEKTESKEECLSRGQDIIAYLKNRFSYGQRIAVISHGAFANNFYQASIGIEHEYDFRFTSENTAVTKIEYTEDGVKRIVFLNDVSHLLELQPEFKNR